MKVIFCCPHGEVCALIAREAAELLIANQEDLLVISVWAGRIKEGVMNRKMAQLGKKKTSKRGK